MITIPPVIVSMLGCSLITNHTQRGPSIVSSKKKRLTSAAVIYLGANVISTKGIATHTTHITTVPQIGETITSTQLIHVTDMYVHGPTT